MKCREIQKILETQSPLSYALSWDNVGLLAGSEKKEIQKIYIALDAVDSVIDAALSAQADLLLTHHPLIFKGIRQITAEDFIGRRLIRLIQNDVCYYAMHTNFDVKGMADLSAAMLGLEDTEPLDVTVVENGGKEGIGRVGSLMEPMSAGHCARFVKAAFSIDKVRVYGDLERVIKRVAVCPGSGKGEIQNALLKGAQVLITGDIGHHDGIDAAAMGLCIIDAGHYGIEHIFIRYMKEYLESCCSGVEILTHETFVPFVTL